MYSSGGINMYILITILRLFFMVFVGRMFSNIKGQLLKDSLDGV